MGVLLGGGRRGREALLLEEEGDRVRRLGAALQPVVDLRDVETELGAARVVRTDALDETAAARAALIGDDDAVEGGLVRARSREADVNGHAE